ncbi:helix-turn-helix transcriptional regulator [Kordia sp. YSTF-M3]|uniref:Helix-turn-helix transcriptional regulator n=1 Tax=Kordia aestuariivivens TaxID=2759037 RepID=A0ABR7Q3K7_9FLAO|nr:helix-turn-helix transcriptional regulator [Kordia aestuariivivens]MBC8753134.1 helix-turn-helix transcriptional regulator [Kordia aestuariivivens]
MKTIRITAEDTAGTVAQIQEAIGGKIIERWGEHILEVNNDIAKGSIHFITFEWGGSLLEYNITFFEEIELVMDASEYNPIHFTYCLKGFCKHRFHDETEQRTLEELQPSIITSKSGGYNHGYFPKDIYLHINVVQISRVKFIRKRLNDASILNQKLYKVFHDSYHENRFVYLGTYNLKLAELIDSLNHIEQKGMIRIMLIEGIVYQILSLHMIQHDKDVKTEQNATPILFEELELVKEIAEEISEEVSKEYTLEQLSEKSGLTQVKLQEGFKHLYARTVTEYIRHVRLEKARDLINDEENNLNISQIVYTIGLSSRSYFSKIFKRKYGISPSQFLKNKQKAKIIA